MALVSTKLVRRSTILSDCGQLFFETLATLQIGVETVQAEQLFVSTPFADPAVIQHQDQIRLLDGRHAMGDEEYRPTAGGPTRR